MAVDDLKFYQPIKLWVEFNLFLSPAVQQRQQLSAMVTDDDELHAMSVDDMLS